MPKILKINSAVCPNKDLAVVTVGHKSRSVKQLDWFLTKLDSAYLSLDRTVLYGRCRLQFELIYLSGLTGLQVWLSGLIVFKTLIGRLAASDACFPASLPVKQLTELAIIQSPITGAWTGKRLWEGVHSPLTLLVSQTLLFITHWKTQPSSADFLNHNVSSLLPLVINWKHPVCTVLKPVITGTNKLMDNCQSLEQE